jgi:hypothetical protein
VASIGLGVVRPGSSVRHRPCNFGPPAPAPTVSASLVTAWVTRMRRRPRPGPFAPDNRTPVPSVSLVSAGPSGAKPPTGLAGLKAQRGARTGPVSAPPGIDVPPRAPRDVVREPDRNDAGPRCSCQQNGTWHVPLRPKRPPRRPWTFGELSSAPLSGLQSDPGRVTSNHCASEASAVSVMSLS